MPQPSKTLVWQQGRSLIDRPADAHERNILPPLQARVRAARSRR